MPRGPMKGGRNRIRVTRWALSADRRPLAPIPRRGQLPGACVPRSRTLLGRDSARRASRESLPALAWPRSTTALCGSRNRSISPPTPCTSPGQADANRVPSGNRQTIDSGNDGGMYRAKPAAGCELSGAACHYGLAVGENAAGGRPPFPDRATRLPDGESRWPPRCRVPDLPASKD